MLHIVLLLLKIIGIILLILLGILVGLILLVLLVPVRYRGSASMDGRPVGRLKVTWLLHLLVLEIEYDRTLQTAVRIFGFRVFRDEADATVHEEPEAYIPDENISFPEDGEDMILSAQDLDRDPLPQPAAREEPPEEKREKPSDEKADIPLNGKKRARSSENRRRISNGVWLRIRKVSDSLRRKICSLPRRIRLLALRIKKAALNIEKTAEKARNFYREAAAFWENEENRRTLRLIRRMFLKLLRHLRPARLEGNITFGLEDPYRMGQILSLCALFYPVYGERIEVCPVFGGNALKGRVRLRGRVRLGTILFIAVRLFFDKNLRKLFRKYMNRGGI